MNKKGFLLQLAVWNISLGLLMVYLSVYVIAAGKCRKRARDALCEYRGYTGKTFLFWPSSFFLDNRLGSLIHIPLHAQ